MTVVRGRSLGRLRPLFFCGLTLAFILLSRLFLAAVPFYNIDEGMYAATANVILDGGVIYKDAVDHSAPVVSYVYALVFLMAGKGNMFAVHVALIVCILSIALIVYAVAHIAGGRGAGYAAILFFSIFSYTYSDLDMLAFHAEWIAVFFCAAAACFFLKHVREDKGIFLLLSGLFLGLAFFSKHLALFGASVTLLFSLIYSPRRSPLLILGFFFAAALFAAYFFVKNALQDFLFYFWQYNATFYARSSSLQATIVAIPADLFGPGSYLRQNSLLIISYITALCIVMYRLYKSKRAGKGLLIDLYLLLWAVFALFGAAYSGRNYGHYYILALPALCIVGGKATGYLYEKSPLYGKALVAAAVATGLIIPLYNYSYRFSASKVPIKREVRMATYDSRGVYALTDYIKNNSDEKDSIFVWGFFPEVYSLAGRRPSSRYINCNFLTGLTSPREAREGIDTSDTIVPGSRQMLMDELMIDPPLYVVDTSVGDHRFYARYPVSTFKELEGLLQEEYTKERVFLKADGTPSFVLYRRI